MRVQVLHVLLFCCGITALACGVTCHPKALHHTSKRAQLWLGLVVAFTSAAGGGVHMFVLRAVRVVKKYFVMQVGSGGSLAMCPDPPHA